MSGTGQDNFQAPDRLTPPSGDQPIGTDTEGRPIRMTMWMFQFLQRLLSYLGQPAKGNKSGQTISQQVGTLNEEMGLALSGPGSAVPGIEGRLAMVEAALRRLSPATSQEIGVSPWRMPEPPPLPSPFVVPPSQVPPPPSSFLIPYPPVKWDAGFVHVVGDGLNLTTDGTLTSQGGSTSMLWNYHANTSITVGPPPAGDVYWNNATQTSATIIGLSHLTFDNFDIDLFLARIATGNTVVIQDANDSNNFQIWTVSAPITIHTNSYVEVPVTLSSSGGTGTTNFPNNHALFVALFTSGSTGTVTQVATSGAGISGGPITTTGTLTVEWNAGQANALDTTEIVNTGNTLTLANRGASVLMGNPGTAAAKPSDIAIGAGLALTTAGTLNAQWNGGTVSAVDPSLTITSGTIAVASTYATQSYVNSQIGLSNNELTAGAATTTTLPANTYANGASGVGATLTATSNGALTVDGVTVVAGGLVLVKNEATAANNGLYVVTQAGDATHPYILTRWTAFNQVSNINAPFLPIAVSGGTVNGNTLWLSAAHVTTVGTDAITFAEFGLWQAPQVKALGSGLVNTSGTLSAGGAGISTLVNGPASQTSATTPMAFPVVVQPGAATFTTWINQNGATITDQTDGGTVLSLTSTGGAGNSITFRGVNVPAGSWTATANGTSFGFSKLSSGGDHLLTLTDGTKLWSIEVQYAGGPQIAVVRYTNSTTFSSTDFFDTYALPNPLWARIIYNSVTPSMTFQYSADGNTWVTIFTTTTLFFTPTQIGFGVDNQGNTKGKAQGVCLNYWHVG